MSDRVFFVVGAAKAGTTSIYHYLKQHPDVYVHAYKDVACYFCARAGLPITFDEFRALLVPKEGRFKVAGDVCSDYLTETNAARDIAAAFPDAKIIVVLRNPADRAFSLYQWMLREGYEYLQAFEAALEAESERAERKLKGSDLVSSSKDAYLYFRSGLYKEQVQRYLDYFDRKSILFLRYEDLKSDSVGFMQEIYRFLGINTDFRPTVQIHNRGAQPISVALQYFYRRRLAYCLPPRVITYLTRLNTSARKRRSQFSRVLRAELLDRYADDIRATEAITGLDLGGWLEK